MTRNYNLTGGTAASLSLSNALIGVFVYKSTKSTVSNNIFYKMGSGVVMEGANQPSMLTCNNFNRCYYSFNFGSFFGAPSVGDQINGLPNDNIYNNQNPQQLHH